MWRTGFVAPRHVGSSQTRAPTRVPLHWQADSQPLRHQGSPHGLLIEITHLVPGLNEAQVLDVSLQKEFNERQSDRLEVDLFREKHTPQTECGPSQKARSLKIWLG